MNPTISFLLLEWRRIRQSLLLAAGIMLLIYFATWLLPEKPGDYMAGVMLIAIPALLVPALFGSFASDRERWPFLFGLPYSFRKLFLLRYFLRLALLAATATLFVISGMAMSHELNIHLLRSFLSIVLLESLLIASVFVFFASLHSGIGQLMTSILGLLVFLPAQLPLWAALYSFDFHANILIAASMLQLILLTTAGGYAIWKRQSVNRSPRRVPAVWTGIILLLPWLEWAGVRVVNARILAAAEHEARQAGIILIEPDTLPYRFENFTIDGVDEFLAQFGYSTDRRPFYCTAVNSPPANRKSVITFVVEAVVPPLRKAYLENDEAALRRAVNAELFCNYVALGNVLHNPGDLSKHEKMFEVIIDQLDQVHNAGFSGNYAFDPRDYRRQNSNWYDFLEQPARDYRAAQSIRREIRAFRDLDRIRAMDTRELEKHMQGAPFRPQLYAAVLAERRQREYFRLFSEAFKLRLGYHRTGKLPDQLDTGLPFRYERTKDGFRFFDKSGNTILNCRIPDQSSLVEGK